ncbi:MAG: aminotransferase class IV [Candidatus Nanopelagicales bacterium]
MRLWVGDRHDGELVAADQATVSVLDHGFTVADGVFETLRVTPSGAFALSRHLSRLATSAVALGIEAPDDDIVRIAVEDVLTANAADSGGRGPLGSDRGVALPTLVVAVAAAQPWPGTTTIATAPWTRNERSAVAGVKSTSYAENVVALAWARDQGASEAVLGNTVGNLCEGTGTNVFVVVDSKVLTAPLSSGCLAGITRELVLEWFGGVEEDLPLSILAEADEVFLTSSTRNVHPVVRADARTWERPGPVSRDLAASFDEQAARDIDP